MSGTWQSPHQVPPKSRMTRLCSRRAWARAAAMSALGLAVSEYRVLLTLSMICAVAEGGGGAGSAMRGNARAGRSVFGDFAIMEEIMDWTLFEFIETRLKGDSRVARVALDDDA